LPFSRKLTPAALPVLTTTSRLARTEVCAGAIRVSSATGLPSAVIETQLVFSARISRVNVIGGFGTAARAVFFASGLATGAAGFAAGLVAAPFVDGMADAEGDAGVLEDAGTDAPGRVGIAVVVLGGLAPEIVPGEIVPLDNVDGGEVCPALSELAELSGRVGAAADAETETGGGAEDGCEEAVGCDAAVGAG
jgi:hypothetical protein